jgi:hypothetical protein
MRSGRATNKINVAEESDDKEEADTEEGVDIADDTTGPVKKVKDAHTWAGRFSEMMFLQIEMKNDSSSMHTSGRKDVPCLARRYALLIATNCKVSRREQRMMAFRNTAWEARKCGEAKR